MLKPSAFVFCFFFLIFSLIDRRDDAAQVRHPQRTGEGVVHQLFHRSQVRPGVLFSQLPEFPLRRRKSHEATLPPRVLMPERAGRLASGVTPTLQRQRLLSVLLAAFSGGVGGGGQYLPVPDQCFL